MTKTLTEQWREGTLPKGQYYVKDWDGTINRFVAQNNILWRDSNNPIYASERIEVLAPVPDYMDYKGLMYKSIELDKAKIKIYELVSKTEQLEKKLEIATKALKEYSESDNWFMEDSEGNCWSFNKKYPWRIGFKALKEMEGVK